MLERWGVHCRGLNLSPLDEDNLNVCLWAIHIALKIGWYAFVIQCIFAVIIAGAFLAAGVWLLLKVFTS